MKKTPLEMKLEAMKKAAIKKQKEEMLKLAAQQAADADTGVPWVVLLRCPDVHSDLTKLMKLSPSQLFDPTRPDQ